MNERIRWVIGDFSYSKAWNTVRRLGTDQREDGRARPVGRCFAGWDGATSHGGVRGAAAGAASSRTQATGDSRETLTPSTLGAWLIFGLRRWNVWQASLKLSDLPDPGVAGPGGFHPRTSPG